MSRECACGEMMNLAQELAPLDEMMDVSTVSQLRVTHYIIFVLGLKGKKTSRAASSSSFWWNKRVFFILPQFWINYLEDAVQFFCSFQSVNCPRALDVFQLLLA